MTHFRLTSALFAAVLGMVAVAPNASAGLWDKKTVLTTSQPLAVEGIVLAPGSYVFKLVDSPSSRHVVQISNVRENHVFATIIAIPTSYMQEGIPANLQGPGAGKTQFTFWETPAGEPPAVKDWYYPGDFWGQQFPYHKTVTQISQVTQPQAPPPVAPVAEAPAPAPEPTIAQNTPPPPPVETPAPAQEATPAPQPAPPAVAENNIRKTIPQTAGNLPLLALLGFGSLTLAAGMSAIAKVIG